jgi:uncharacterized protein with GYD domain
MTTYVELLRFTDQGIRNVKQTTERAEAFKAAVAEHMGVTVKEIYWTMGAYDMLVIVDAPDDESVAALGLALGALGNVRGQSMRAFNAEQMRAVLDKMPEE